MMPSTKPDAPRDSRDAGVSLVELIVYVLLAGLLLSGVAVAFVDSLNTQRDVVSKNEATNRGQVFGQSIERAMRNAVAFDVSPDGSMLRVRTTLGAESRCQAFWITGGAAYMTNSSGLLPGAVVATWPPAWEQNGVVPNGGTPIFAQTVLNVKYTFDIQTNSVPMHFRGRPRCGPR